MEKLSRKEREYNARRKEILKAAEKVFAQNGFHNSTVAEIARASEFAIGTLYQFFKNKEELYYTMMIEKFDLLYTTLVTNTGTTKKCFEKLTSVVEVVFSFIENNVDFFKIFTWELNVLVTGMENELKQELINKHFSYIKIISNIIKEGIHEGELKEGNADDLSSALVGMMNVFSFNWLLNQQQGSLMAKAPAVINLFLNGASRSG